MTMFEEGEELVTDEVDLALFAARGSLRDLVRAWLRNRRYHYYYGKEILDRARGRHQLLQVGPYVVYSLDHFGPDNGRFIKVGSTIDDPIARAHAHFASRSSSPNTSN